MLQTAHQQLWELSGLGFSTLVRLQSHLRTLTNISLQGCFCAPFLLNEMLKQLRMFLFAGPGDSDRMYPCESSFSMLLTPRQYIIAVMVQWCVTLYSVSVYALILAVTISFFMKRIWNCKSQAIRSYFHRTFVDVSTGMEYAKANGRKCCSPHPS